MGTGTTDRRLAGRRSDGYIWLNIPRDVQHRLSSHTEFETVSQDIVKTIDTLTNAVGLYVLTADAELGVFGEDHRFVVDQTLTQTFGLQIRPLLQSYLENPGTSGIRLGAVYHSRANKSWRSDTFVLEEHVLREVYPVGGPPGQELTAFQKKNRIKSIYRGIELLIEYRHDRLADSPVYCPLLFDRGTSLDQYPWYPGLDADGGERAPVVEVLNLLGMLPPGRRKAQPLLALMREMHRYSVRKDMRHDDGLAIVQRDAYVPPKSDDSAAADYFDADKRHDRRGSLLSGRLGHLLAVAEQAQHAERFHQVEQWLERPQRAVDPELLRGFLQFRALDDAQLIILAEKALVYTAPTGVPLLDIGMKDSWNMYLLEGTVSLQAADGGSLFVTGGTDKAASPIAFLKPRKYAVTSVTPVSFLWVHDALLQAVTGGSAGDNAPPSEFKPIRS